MRPPRFRLWYGWPDYYGQSPLTWAGHYQGGEKKPPEFLLAQHPNQPPKPAAIFGVHASANGIEFPPNDRFGYVGHAFVAQFGDMSPKVGRVYGPVGFNVVTVDPATGVITPFAANKGKHTGPASRIKTAGLERPNDVAFSPDGTVLYIADFGILTVDNKGPHPQKGTGVIWRITRDAKREVRR